MYIVYIWVDPVVLIDTFILVCYFMIVKRELIFHNVKFNEGSEVVLLSMGKEALEDFGLSSRAFICINGYINP